MTPESKDKYCFADRCAGAILGTAFGDALGAGVEGCSAAEIARDYGEVVDYLDVRSGAGRYTDDTQMMLATARSLVRMGKVDGADCAKACAEHFDPERGYGRSANEILSALKNGADYTKTGTMLFSGGSYGNGAAMRIAPVGLFCGDMEPDLYRATVYDSVRATHDHDEAIDGALVMAVAIGRLSRNPDRLLPDVSLFLRDLASYCRTMEMRSSVILASRLLEEEPSREEIIGRLGHGVRTVASVPTALYTAMKFVSDPEKALVAAVGYGGDTDTIAAMTGALVGAMNGAQAFPPRWHDGLERGADGYHALVTVSEQLYTMACK